MCFGGKNNPVTAKDYYEGYQAEDGSYVGGMKKSYELPSLSMETGAEREQSLENVDKPEGGLNLMRGTGQSGKKRRTFFTQYGTGT